MPRVVVQTDMRRAGGVVRANAVLMPQELCPVPPWVSVGVPRGIAAAADAFAVRRHGAGSDGTWARARDGGGAPARRRRVASSVTHLPRFVWERFAPLAQARRARVRSVCH